MTREEAINEIRSWCIASKNGREVLETLIPELRESEDEGARKHLVNICNEWLGGSWSARPCLNDIKWLKNLLEKQKEQKSIGTDFRTAVKNLMNLHKIKNKFTEEDYDFHTKELLELVEQKPVDF